MNLQVSQQAAEFIRDVDALGERHPVSLDGRVTMWRRFGRGRPVVLLHGGHGSWLHWIRNILALSNGRSVWVPDMPGYGDSDALDPSAGIEDLLTAMLAMLEEIFQYDRAVDFAGFSFGGLVAANIAARWPKVARLALVGSAGHGGKRRQTVALKNWRLCTSEADLETTMRYNLAAHMLSNPGKIDALALAVHIRSCQRTRFRSKAISRAGALPEVLQASDIPTLLAWGVDDVTADPAAIVPALTDGYPKRTGHLIPNAGHWVQFENSEQVNTMLDNWFV